MKNKNTDSFFDNDDFGTLKSDIPSRNFPGKKHAPFYLPNCIWAEG